MATIREIQASFIARANGMKSTIQGVKKDIQGLAKDTKKVTGGMSKDFTKGTSNISKQFRNMSLSASKEFDNIGKSIQTAGTHLESWGSDLKTLGKTTTKVLSPLTAFYATAAITGGSRMIANEQLDILMRNVFRTEEAYEGAWDAVHGLTKGTAFMNIDVGGWLSQLVQSNIELDKSEGIMKSILDFAVGSGQLGIEGEIHDIIMKAVRAGGWDQMTLDMLAQRGLNLAGHIANVLGIETTAAQDMLKDGTISMEDSLDYFVDAVQVGSEGAGGYFAKMADSAQAGGDTMLGAWINTKAALAQLGQDMWESGAWDVLKEALNSITAFLYQLSPALEPIAKVIASMLATMVNWLQKLMTAFINLRPKTQALIASLSVIGAVLGPAIYLFGTFVGAVGLALKPLGALFLGLSKVFGVIGKKGLGGAIKALLGRFTFLTRAFSILTGPIGIVISLFTLLYTTSQTFRTALHDVIGSVIDFGKGIYDRMKPAIDTVVDSFKAMMESFKGTGGGLDSLGAAFAPLLDVIGFLAKLIIGTLAVAFSIIIPLISGVIRAIGPLVKTVSSLISIVVNLGMAILSVFMLDFSKAMDHFKAAFQSAIDFFVNLWGVFAGFFGGFITSLLAQLEPLFGGWDNLGAIAGRVWNGIISLLDKVKESFVNLVDSLSIQPIIDFFLSIGETAKQAGADIAKSLIDGMTQAFDGLVASSRSLFSNVGERISDSISTGLNNKAGDLVKGYFNSIKESLQSAGGIATMIAPSLIGIGSRLLGLTGPVGLVISIISSLVSTFVRLYKTNEGFRDFIHDTWQGIQDVFSSAFKSLAPIFDEFQKAFGQIVDDLGPEFAKTKEIIVDSINELKPTFEELGASFSELGQTFGELFKEIGQVIGSVIKEIVPVWIEFQLTIYKTIFSLAKEIIPVLLQVFKTVFSAILSIIQAVIPIVLQVFTALIDVVLELAKVIIPLILSVIKTVLPAVLSIVQSVISLVVSVFTLLIDVVLELVKAVLPMILSVVKTVFSVVLTIISTVLPIIVNLLTTVINVILELAKAVIPLILSVVQAVFPIIQKIIEIATQIITFALKLLVGVIQNVVVPAIEFILKIVQTVFPVIVKVIEGALNIVIGILDFFVALFTGNWSGMWDAIKKILNGAVSIIWSVVKGTFDLIALFIKTIFNSISSFFSMIWSVITKTFKTVITAIYNYVVDRFTAIRNTTTTIFTAIWNFLRNIWNTVLNFIINIIVTLFNRFVNGWRNIYNNTKTIFTNVWNFLRDIWNKVKNFIFNAVSSIFTRVRNTWNNLKDRTTEIFQGIYDAVKSKFDDIVDAAKKLPGRISDGLKSMASKVKSGVRSVVNAMGGLLEDGLNGVIGGINWVLNKIGVSDSNQINEVSIPKFAKGGTHKGGLMFVGDGGKQELVQTPDGKTMLSPDTDTLMNAPKGTKILSGEDTEKLLNSIPAYKSGNSSISDMAKGAWGATKRGANAVKDTAVDAGKAVGRGAKQVGEWAGDAWDYVKNPSKLLNIALEQLGVSTPKGGSFIGDVAKGGFNTVKGKAAGYIKDMFKKAEEESSAGPSSPGAAAWRSHIVRAAARMNESINSMEISGIIAQIHRESGGNQKIVQSPQVVDINTLSGNPARGLLQYIPQTFAAYKIPGHGNIYSGYDQLLAFFNNKTWRRDLPYGKRGWGPRGARKYADGGIVDTKQLAWIADGGWAESIISHDPSKQVRQEKIWRETGDRLGFTDNEYSKQMLSELEKIAKAVEKGDEQVVRAIEQKPVLSEGDIKRSYDKLDSRQSTNQDIFTGRPGGA